MANNAGSTKTDTAVKLVLIFFISLLSFSVGTFVGEQFTKQEYKQASTTEEYKSIGNHSEEVQTEEAVVSEEEVASLTEEFLKEEKTKTREVATADSKTEDGYSHYTSSDKKTKDVAENKSPAKADKKASTDAKKNVASHKPSMSKAEKVTKEADRVAKGHAPSKDPKKRKIASVLPSVASSAVGKYTVQVASYATETEAKSHAARLKGKGLHAFFIPATVKGKTWYRVSVGLFPTQTNAVKYQKELQAQAGVSSSIVQKIVK